MTVRDYNSIKWENHFYIDEESPSGLSRKVDTYAGMYHKQLKYKAGSVAGSIQQQKGVIKGWIVELDSKPYKVHRIIQVLLYGRIDNDKVVDHLDGNPMNNTLSNLCIKTCRANSQNACLRHDNTSGVKGVNLSTSIRGSNTYQSWTATWYSTGGKKTTKTFSVNKHGYETAKQLAINHRNLQISRLNAAGASYTERHIGLTPATPPAISPVQPT